MGTMTKSVGEQTADTLAAEVRQAREDHGAEFATESAPWRELNRRAVDGEQDAIDLLAELAAEAEALAKGADIAAATPEPEPDPAEDQNEAASVEEAARAVEESLPEAADEQPVSGEIVVQGDIEQLAFGGFAKAVGGKKPTGSKVRLTGGAFAVEGGLTKGATYIFEVEARVGGVSFDDKIDSKTTQAVDCERGHKARITGAMIVPAKTTERLEELQDAVRAYFETPDDAPALELVGAENRVRLLLGLPEAVE